MSNFNLSDSWSASGNDLSSYTALIKEVSDATKFIKTKPSEIKAFYNLRDANVYDVYKVVVIDGTSLSTLKKGLMAWKTTMTQAPEFNVGYIRKAKTNQLLAEESFNSNGFILDYNEKAIYVSANAKTTLCLRSKIAGEWTTRCSLFQTMDIMEALNYWRGEMTMVVRECENPRTKKIENKVFAFLSSKYTDIPLSILPKAIKTIMADGKLGRAEVYGWYMNHMFTEIQIEFPDAGEDFAAISGLKTPVIPGLIMMSSDTGSSSLIIRGTYRVKGSSRYVVLDEFTHKHSGAITTEDILDACDRHIMSNFRKLPEALADKMSKIIGTGKVDTPQEMAANAQAVAGAIKGAMKKLGVNTELGKTRSKMLLEQLIETIDPESVYSEYDLAMLFLGLPDRVDGLSKEMQTRLAKDCGKAPFIDYTANTEKVDDEDLVLLPEE